MKPCLHLTDVRVPKIRPRTRLFRNKYLGFRMTKRSRQLYLHRTQIDWEDF